MDNISDVMVLTRLVMRFNKRFTEDEVVLFEDLLEGNFKTFVTNKGETTPQGTQSLDAFCHFTYHASNQQFVVCNLRGVEDEDELEHFKFTEPVVHSVDGSFGSSDKSVTGIRDFFKNHVCSSLCKDYSKPSDFILPSAPCKIDDACTSSKTTEANTYAQKEVYELPVFMSEDPNAPPPYDAQWQHDRF